MAVPQRVPLGLGSIGIFGAILTVAAVAGVVAAAVALLAIVQEFTIAPSAVMIGDRVIPRIAGREVGNRAIGLIQEGATAVIRQNRKRCKIYVRARLGVGS